LKPNDPHAWYGLGKTHAARGERAQVIEVYRRLKELHGGLAEGFFRSHILP